MRVEGVITCDICKETILSSDKSSVTVVHDPNSTDIYFNDTCPDCSTAILTYITSIKK